MDEEITAWRRAQDTDRAGGVRQRYRATSGGEARPRARQGIDERRAELRAAIIRRKRTAGGRYLLQDPAGTRRADKDRGSLDEPSDPAEPDQVAQASAELKKDAIGPSRLSAGDRHGSTGAQETADRPPSPGRRAQGAAVKGAGISAANGL